jgi:hypothetical protein
MWSGEKNTIKNRINRKESLKEPVKGRVISALMIKSQMISGLTNRDLRSTDSAISIHVRNVTDRQVLIREGTHPQIPMTLHDRIIR